MSADRPGPGPGPGPGTDLVPGPDASWSPVPRAAGAPPGPVGSPPSAVLPAGPVSYPQLLRGPRRRWWKPLLAVVLVAFAAAVAITLTVVVTAVVGGAALGVPDLGRYVEDQFDLEDFSPVGFLAGNLALAVLVPVAGLSVWAVHRVRPRYLSSVAGGLRWRWLLRCVVVLLPLWVVVLGVGVLMDPPTPGRPPHWVALLVIVLLTTPLQAAGEEYLFRGFLLQDVGAWFARPALALAVPTVLSVVTFAAAHGSPDPWVLADLGCFAAGACVLTWRTGGLEAAIALHTVNNVLLFGVVVGVGGWQEAFVDAGTTSTPGAFAVSAVSEALAVALLWWQARRTGVQQHHRPDGPRALGSASRGLLLGASLPAVPAQHDPAHAPGPVPPR